MSNEAEHNKRLVSESMAFMASVIKSGEGWSEQCQHIYERAQEALNAPPSVEAGAVPDGYVVQCRDGGFGRVHETEQAARESIQRGGGSGNIRPVFVGSDPTPPASAGGLDKEALLESIEDAIEKCNQEIPGRINAWDLKKAAQHEAVRDFAGSLWRKIQSGDFDLDKQGGAA